MTRDKPERRCAFLTMRGGATADDLLARPSLTALGWWVETVPWRRAGVEWRTYEAVIIRSPWDYHREPDRFLRVLEAIHDSGARLENPLDLVRWNVRKTYLRDLSARGSFRHVSNCCRCRRPLAMEARRRGQRFYCALPVDDSLEQSLLQRLRASVGLSLIEIGGLEV